MKSIVSLRVFGLAYPLLFLLTTSAFSGEAFVDLSLQQWGQPHDAQDVVNIAPLRDAIKKVIKNPGTQLIILYPGDDQGAHWAKELHGWLVALGIDSGRVQMKPESYRANVVELGVKEMR
jgi:hypothetical protein